jgi:hypothetical protein
MSDTMTAEEFATQIELVIAQGRARGLSAEAIIAGLEKAVDALDQARGLGPAR